MRERRRVRNGRRREMGDDASKDSRGTAGDPNEGQEGRSASSLNLILSRGGSHPPVEEQEFGVGGTLMTTCTNPKKNDREGISSLSSHPPLRKREGRLTWISRLPGGLCRRGVTEKARAQPLSRSEREGEKVEKKGGLTSRS